LVERLSYEANFKRDSGSYSNINEYILDEIETSGEINRNIVYRKWNISEYGGNVVDIFNCDSAVLEKYLGIVNRFKYLIEANTIILDKEEEIEEIEATYAKDMMDILKRFPKLETVIREEVKNALNEKKDFVQVDKPFFMKTLNEIMDKAIENNQNILSDEEKQQFEVDRRNAMLNADIKKRDALDIKSVRHGRSYISDNMMVGVQRVNTGNADRDISESSNDLILKQKRANEKAKARYEAYINNGDTDYDYVLGILNAWGIATTVIGNRLIARAVAENTQGVNAAQGNTKPAGRQAGGNTSGKGGTKGGGTKSAGGKAKARTKKPKEKEKKGTAQADTSTYVAPVKKEKARESGYNSHLNLAAQGAGGQSASTNDVRRSIAKRIKSLEHDQDVEQQGLTVDGKDERKIANTEKDSHITY